MKGDIDMKKTEWRVGLEKRIGVLTERALQEAKMGVLRVMMLELTVQLKAKGSDADLLEWVSQVTRLISPRVGRVPQVTGPEPDTGAIDG